MTDVTIDRIIKERTNNNEPIYDFRIGEPNIKPPIKILNAQRNPIQNYSYPTKNDTFPALNSIANYLSAEHIQFIAENIVCTNGGGRSAIDIAMRTLPHDLLIPTPSWNGYEEIAAANGKAFTHIPCTIETNFKVTPDLLKKYINNPTPYILVLCTPNNPTGSCYTKKELESLAVVCIKNNVQILSDEVYREYSHKHISIADVSSEIATQTIIIGSLSKGSAYPAERLGYIATKNAVYHERFSQLFKVTQTAVNIHSLVAAEIAFSEKHPETDAHRREVYRKQKEGHFGLSQIEGVTCPMPDGGFYLFIDIKPLLGGSHFWGINNFCIALAQETGVLVNSGTIYNYDSGFRLCVTPDNYQEGLSNLCKFLKKSTK